jgi:hypothetical protein
MKMRILLLGAMLAVLSGSVAWAGEGFPKGGGPGMEPGGPEEREALEFIKEAAPEMQDEFFRARKEKPAAFRKRLRGMAPMLKDPKTRETLKKQFKLDFEVRRLAKEMRGAKGEAKEALKKDLAKALSDQFDAKLDLQVKRLQKMKDDISDLEGRISKRKVLKGEIVKKRLAELSGDAEPWDW